uniref:non-specific serine/threonine protein kinase n=1 Tax=Kalanchoe fedtschenkoi TaxID=63787 RepID=A0A7N0UQT1_KALFE
MTSSSSPKSIASAFSLLFLLAMGMASADDAAVMSLLRTSLINTGWSQTLPFCKWKGVKCDASDRVTDINLQSSSVSGTLPSTLNNLSRLNTLTLQKNSISGSLPTLADLSSLQIVYVDNNNFTSIPGTFFDGLTSLQEISVGDNPFLTGWNFPAGLTASSGLVKLFAGSANMYGQIPDLFASWPNLQDLRLSYNNLTGPLPPSFAGSEIRNLWLNNQVTGLSGPIDVLGKMTQLSQVWLHKNAFSGPIPDLSDCTSLFDLQLRDNQLTGVVPPSLMTLSALVNITLQNNKLQGPVPVFAKLVDATVGTNFYCETEPGPCDAQVTTLLEVAGAMGYPATLAESWTGNDACQWTYILCDAQSKKVTKVNLSKRNFTGTISPAYANLTSLTSLLLNDNQLTGSIPESLTTLPQLKILDVSNNNLSGEKPVFGAGVTVNTAGNSQIGKTGGGSTGPSSSNGDSNSNSKDPSASVIVGIVLGVVVFALVVGFVFYRYIAKKRLEKFGRVESSDHGKEVAMYGKPGTGNGYHGAPADDSLMQSQNSEERNDFQVFEGGNVVISIQVLKQVTANFNEDNILGRGGFGVVYKGELHDGTRIAVKRMECHEMGNKGLIEFKAEIGVLTKVRHRHLVALLGYCINDKERLLVYEYMPQGTLGQHLFEYKSLGYPPLTWKQRVTIALDVARGVEYLHSMARESFIHRDLKPSNILLGDDMRAKVADFGLVKSAPDGKYSLETKLAGTFGYLAPEYAATGRVTTKVDVFAYGVVLMEMLTGRKALDDKEPEERSHLVTWFRRVLINKEDLLTVIDQTLQPDEETYASIRKVAELAGHCTAREPFQRPDMGHAVNVLGPLVEEWKPSSQEEDDGYAIDLHMSLPQALQRWQADEGTSTLNSDFFNSRMDTQSSIPSKPSGIADTFNSNDCR